MPARVLVVDRSASTRDAIAELLGEHAEVTWAPRDAAAALVRAQVFDAVLVDADPAPTPARRSASSPSAARASS